jgi:hypothetical protein
VGCNCGKAARQVWQYEFTSPTGTVRVYNSEVEAQAARIRAKGGTVRAVPAG